MLPRQLPPPQTSIFLPVNCIPSKYVILTPAPSANLKDWTFAQLNFFLWPLISLLSQKLGSTQFSLIQWLKSMAIP